MSTNRRGIPGPDRRTGLVRPTMTEAEFEKNLSPDGSDDDMTNDEAGASGTTSTSGSSATMSASNAGSTNGAGGGTDADPTPRTSGGRAGRSVKTKAAKPRRIQRMFAIEEDLDRKLWLYAIHMGKDRSEIINDLLRPIVASMIVYDGRDRRSSSSSSNLAESA